MDGLSVKGRAVSLDLLIQMRSELSPKNAPVHMSEHRRRRGYSYPACQRRDKVPDWCQCGIESFFLWQVWLLYESIRVILPQTHNTGCSCHCCTLAEWAISLFGRLGREVMEDTHLGKQVLGLNDWWSPRWYKRERFRDYEEENTMWDWKRGRSVSRIKWKRGWNIVGG